MKHIGIDFGAKKAGTTAICFNDNNKLEVIISEKNQDADKFISSFIDSYNPSHVFIDAPLSLPAAFYGRGDNFFYRECDVITKAMSPMFLGGLTARAISLKNQFKNIMFIETYPKILANFVDICEYKKNRVIFVNKIETKFDIKVGELENWHQIDSVLAFCSGLRFIEGEQEVYGNEEEGLIIV